MRLSAMSRFQNAILQSSCNLLLRLGLVLAVSLVFGLLVGTRAQAQAQAPTANASRRAQPAASQAAAPNAAAAQTASREVVPLSPQDLPLDPLRSAIQDGIQKGTQEQKPYPPATQAKQPAAGNTAHNPAQSVVPDSASNVATNTSPAVSTAANPNQLAAAMLVCQGTRPNGSNFTLLFDPNASPAPAAGDGCIPSGQKMAKGTAIMSTQPKTGPALAVVVPSTPAGGANTTGGGGNTSATGSASERLVCQGTRPATGAAFTLLFDPNASPAPAAGDGCIPSGQKMAKGTAIMSTQPKTGPALAVVFVPPTPAKGANTTAGGANTSAAGSASERLVCQGTRPATGAAFTLLFDPSASPAPAAGDGCIPSGQKMAKGTAIMSTQPKTGPALAVVFVPPTPAKGANTTAGGANTSAAGSAAAATGPIPAAINAGIQSMASAKTSLENSGNKWGGHKEPAIKLIDEALKACGQTATPDNTGTKPNLAGETAAMEAALKQLTAAQNHFNSATNAWGGRRDQAKALISQALGELNAGIAFAKSHNTY